MLPERMTYADYCAFEREAAVKRCEPRLELQVRQADGRWALIEIGAGQRLEIDPLGIGIDVDEVYRAPPTT